MPASSLSLSATSSPREPSPPPQTTSSTSIGASMSPTSTLVRSYNDTTFGADGTGDPRTQAAVLAGAATGSLLLCLILIVMLVVYLRRKRRSGKQADTKTVHVPNNSDFLEDLPNADVRATPLGDPSPMPGVIASATPAPYLPTLAPTPGVAARRRSSIARVAASPVDADPLPILSTAHPRVIRGGQDSGDQGLNSPSGARAEALVVPNSQDRFVPGEVIPPTTPTLFPRRNSPPRPVPAAISPDRSPLPRRVTLPYAPASGAPAPAYSSGVPHPSPMVRRSSLTDAGTRALMSPAKPPPAGTQWANDLSSLIGGGLRTPPPPPFGARSNMSASTPTTTVLQSSHHRPQWQQRQLLQYGAAVPVPDTIAGQVGDGSRNVQQQWASPTMAPFFGRRQSFSAQPVVRSSGADIPLIEPLTVSGARQGLARREPSQAQVAGAMAMGSPFAGQAVRHRRDSA